MSRRPGTRRAVVAAAVALALGGAIPHATAQMRDAATSGGLSVATAQLLPPTNPATAHGSCVPALSVAVVVSWTATASTWASGYQVYRSTTSGGPYSLVATVVGRTTTSYTDAQVSFSTTYHYVVRATKTNWRSAFTTQVSRTTRSALCV